MKTIKIDKTPEGVPYQLRYIENGKLSFSRVSIYETRFGNSDYGINWSALGTVSAEEAEDYVGLINEAIKICKNLNK